MSNLTMFALSATLGLRYQYLTHWHFNASQSTGWKASSRGLLAAAVGYLLAKRFKYGVWKSTWYSELAAGALYGAIEAWSIVCVYFNKPDILGAAETGVHPATSRNKVSEPSKLTHTVGLSFMKDYIVQSSITNTNAYEHEPLEETEFTRLLLLKPAWSSSAELQGELIKYPMNTAIYYGALSYTWDLPCVSDFIIIDGRKLPITTNCAAALRHLRHRVKARMLWVDSICIDQQNVEEKSEQLGAMGTIYHFASYMVVWPGQGTKAEAAALRYLRLYSLTMYLPSIVRTKCRQMIYTRILKRGHGHVFTDLLKNPWFTRMWTIQEIVFTQPRCARLMCGSIETNFDWVSPQLSTIHLDMTYRASHYILDQSAISVGYMARVFERNAALDSTKSDSTKSLQLLVTWLQSHNATDPRDKIYALLTIFARYDLHSFPEPSYAKSTGRVYWDAMIALCRHERSLDFLILCAGQRRSDMADVPTWVPDFRVRGTPRRILLFHNAATSNDPSRFVFSPDGCSLTTTAVIVDEIQFISEETVWQPASSDGVVRDSITSNLENVEAAEKTVLALGDWICQANNARNKLRYEDWLDAVRETVLSGPEVDHIDGTIDGTEDLFKAWMNLLKWGVQAWLESKLPHRQPSSKGEEMDFLYKLVHDHALNNPVLSREFFDPSSLRHEHTKDLIWLTLCVLKTTPGVCRVHHHIWTMARDSKFFITRTGYIGTAVEEIQEGDLIALFPGVRKPMALRNRAGDRYEVVGTTHTQGLMDGKWWDNIKVAEPERLKTVILV